MKNKKAKAKKKKLKPAESIEINCIWLDLPKELNDFLETAAEHRGVSVLDLCKTWLYDKCKEMK